MSVLLSALVVSAVPFSTSQGLKFWFLQPFSHVFSVVLRVMIGNVGRVVRDDCLGSTLPRLKVRQSSFAHSFSTY